MTSGNPVLLCYTCALVCFLPLLEIHNILCSALVVHNSEKCMVVKAAYRFYRFVIDFNTPNYFPVSGCDYTPK